MPKVLITGITGFLGSNIAQLLAEKNIEIVGLKRKTSDTWRCSEFFHQIDWIDIDDNGEWKTLLLEKAPTAIIHGAWIGVEAKERDNWLTQVKNIEFFVNLLEIGRQLKLDKFIFLGSQAEYGNIDGLISEDKMSFPKNAYAANKIACLELCKSFSDLYNINWVWLRLFSLFGEKEDKNWLIPSMIDKMQSGKEMDFTEGKQKYAYLYVKDFSNIVYRLLFTSVSSGIYNVSSNKTHELRSLIEEIRNTINPEFILNFGALPYRENQSMHIEGDISKLASQIGKIDFTDFNVALRNTINYYKSK